MVQKKVMGLRLMEQKRTRGGEISDRIPPELRKNPVAARCYKETLAVTRGSSLLLEADKRLLIAFCQAWATLQNATAKCEQEGEVCTGSKDTPILNPWVRVRNSACENLRRLGEALGLSPASRKKLSLVLSSAPSGIDPDDFEEDFELSDAELAEIERRARRSR